MQCAVLTFMPRTGTGTQTVTGVVDRDGNPFVGKLFLFQGAAPTSVAPGDWTNLYCDFRGADTGAVRSTVVVGDETFGFKHASGGFSAGDYSVADYRVQTLFGGAFYQLAKISAIRSGEFDLLFDLNARTGRMVLCVVFGGDDLSIDLPNTINNGTYATTAPPKAILAMPTRPLAASGGQSTGSGGAVVPWGWDTLDGVRAAASINVVAQGNNFRVQRDDALGLTVDNSGVLSSSRPIVSAWNTNSLTISGNSGGDIGAIGLVFGGTNIVSAAGMITQPLLTGSQSFSVPIDAKFIMFLSTGTASPTPDSPVAQMTHGWANGVNQVGFWAGERRNGNTLPLYGWRNVDDATVLRFGTPENTSTVWTSIASVTSIDPTGTVTLNWSAVDGEAHEIYWLALGEVIAPPPSIGTLLTQLPIGAAYPYQAVSSLVAGTGRSWVTPPPTRSRRGR